MVWTKRMQDKRAVEFLDRGKLLSKGCQKVMKIVSLEFG